MAPLPAQAPARTHFPLFPPFPAPPHHFHTLPGAFWRVSAPAKPFPPLAEGNPGTFCPRFRSRSPSKPPSKNARRPFPFPPETLKLVFTPVATNVYLRRYHRVVLKHSWCQGMAIRCFSASTIQVTSNHRSPLPASNRPLYSSYNHDHDIFKKSLTRTLLGAYFVKVVQFYDITKAAPRKMLLVKQICVVIILQSSLL